MKPAKNKRFLFWVGVRLYIVVIGDSNLDSNKWNDPLFTHKEMVFRLRDVLEQNGMETLIIGNTYQADHAQANGKIAESALDQIYARINEENKVTVKKLENSSTDQVPVVIMEKLVTFILKEEASIKMYNKF